MIIVLGVAIIMIIIVMSIILIASYCYVATSTIIPLCTNKKHKDRDRYAGISNHTVDGCEILHHQTDGEPL